MRRRIFKAHGLGRAFTLLPNETINDPRLVSSPLAFYILSYLLAKPDDWETSLAELRKHFKVGRDSVQKALRTLRAAGYARLETQRGLDGRLQGTVWNIYALPGMWQDESLTHREPEIPAVGDTGRRRYRPPVKPTAGKPGTIQRKKRTKKDPETKKEREKTPRAKKRPASHQDQPQDKTPLDSPQDRQDFAFGPDPLPSLAPVSVATFRVPQDLDAFFEGLMGDLQFEAWCHNQRLVLPEAPDERRERLREQLGLCALHYDGVALPRPFKHTFMKWVANEYSAFSPQKARRQPRRGDAYYAFKDNDASELMARNADAMDRFFKRTANEG